MIRSTALIFVIIAAGLIAGVLWVVEQEALKAFLGDEVYGTLFQFWVLVILGGAVSFVYQQYNGEKEQREQERRRARERREEETRMLLQTSNELVSAYNKTKRVRLLLRARVLPGTGDLAAAGTLSASAYDAQMEPLIDAQLEFESIERRVRANPYLFEPELYGELRGALDQIEEYLTITLNEYEDQRTCFDAHPSAERSLAELPALGEFLGPINRDARASAAIRMPFRTALRCLRLEVQKRSLVPSPGQERNTVNGETARTLSSLGLQEGELRLVAYQQAWSEEFGCEAERLRKAVGVHARIEHIGSTAVPGLAATPVLDLLLRVDSLEEAEKLIPLLASADYLHDADVILGDRCLLRRWHEERCTHHLWLAVADSDFCATAVRLRDHLRGDDKARRLYETRKRVLINARRNDPAGYSAAIGELSRQTLQQK